jgi:hypothetical protein
MDKNKKQIIITGILIIVLIFAVLNASRKFKKARAVVGASSVSAVTQSVPVSDVIQLPTKKSEADLKWVRDPFSGRNYSAGSARKGAVDLKLVGITWDKVSPMAIINNKVVGVGDSVAGNLVIQINEGSVVLNDGTRDFELKL